MTGYESKKAMAQAKLEQAKEILLQHSQKDIDWQREQQIKAHTKLNDDDDDTQVYKDHGVALHSIKHPPGLMDEMALTIAYQSGYYDGKKAAQPAQESWREFASDYERGFIDGMQKQAQSSVDKAVNRMTQRPWVSLTDDEIKEIVGPYALPIIGYTRKLFDQIEAKLREKNGA